MNPNLAQTVRDRAGDICEYCLMPQKAKRLKFQIDHIVAKQHGGSDSSDNLSLACGRCNRYKGPNIGSIDPLTKQRIELFNPRQDKWENHFRFEGPKIAGLTPVGRATVELLFMNHPDEIAVRSELIQNGWRLEQVPRS